MQNSGFHVSISPMVYRIIVQRGEKETSSNLLRRFSKKMQTSAISNKVRGNISHDRKISKFTKKKNALVRIERRKLREKLYDEGRLKQKGNRR